MSGSPTSKPRLQPTWSKGGKSFKTPSAASTVGEGEMVTSDTGLLTNTSGNSSSTSKGGNSGVVRGDAVGGSTTGSSFTNTSNSTSTSRDIPGVGYGGNVVSKGGIGGLCQGRWVNG